MASYFFMVYQENHEEAQEELPKKVKFFFSAAVQNWDAEFYVKVDDNIDLDLGRHFLVYLLSWWKLYLVRIPHQQLYLSDNCFLSDRGHDWSSWKSAWSRCCLHWVHEVWGSGCWRVRIILKLSYILLPLTIYANFLISIYMVLGFQGRAMVWARMVEIWGRKIVCGWNYYTLPRSSVKSESTFWYWTFISSLCLGTFVMQLVRC